MKRQLSVAVTGAAGQIGYAFVFRLLSGQVFGQDVSLDLRLIELPQAMPALTGIEMEIDDCFFPLLSNLTMTDNLEVGFSDADWIICIGSVPRKQGMERQDLLKVNGHVFAEQGRVMNQCASADAKVLVVGNPCNTNAFIAKSHAPRLKSKNFYAMTMLDQRRAQVQLMRKAKLSQAIIEDCIIWGNHSATQFPDYENTTIDGKSALSVIDNESWLQHDFVEMIQQRGAAVIKARGASSAASAANAIVETIAYIEGVRYAESFSLGVASQGEYGSPNGLIVSLPCRRGANGSIEVIEGIQHSSYASQKIQESFKELESEYDMVKGLGLLE